MNIDFMAWDLLRKHVEKRKKQPKKYSLILEF